MQRCKAVDPTTDFNDLLFHDVACPFHHHCPSQVFGTMEDLQRVVDQGIEGILELHQAALKTSKTSDFLVVSEWSPFVTALKTDRLIP